VTIVALVAPGSMGAAVGGRLAANGVVVRTSLEGRSAASRERAFAAGLKVVPEERLLEADLVLSIVPPGAAAAFAERAARLALHSRWRPLFVDCNAVSPATVQSIARTVSAAGLPFVDAGIVGGPPSQGVAGPHIYACGPHAPRFAELRRHGLEIRIMRGAIGAASALKMSYAGITKGLTAVATTMLLAARRNGVAQELRAELAESQERLLATFVRTVPGMFPKAYRWVAEMHEIAAFAAEDAAAAAIFRGAAALYERMAADVCGSGAEAGELMSLLGRETEG
jgi:L-threonate 2-dehydrogenase